jgi:thiol-disulfide isomerase/thioredoxin
MRRLLTILATATLCGPALAGSARAQDPAQSGSQAASKSTTQAAQPQNSQEQASADSSNQPMSLADLARAARAKKPGGNSPAPKVSKVLDDDNMPRGVYDTTSPSPAATPNSRADGSASASSSPFAEFRGKVILLDFWASWCPPCRRSLPSVKRLQAVYGSADFVVISISEDDDEAAWRSFVSTNQMNWPQRLDSNGALQSQYGVSALPTYVLLGRDGSVLQKFVGEAPAESIVERIGPDLKAGLSAKP